LLVYYLLNLVGNLLNCSVLSGFAKTRIQPCNSYFVSNFLVSPSASTNKQRSSETYHHSPAEPVPASSLEITRHAMKLINVIHLPCGFWSQTKRKTQKGSKTLTSVHM
jgi:hypothetical protein